MGSLSRRQTGSGGALYIHIPFCKQKCYYCDFHFSTSLKWKDEMLKALVKELELRKDELKGLTIETIYFGGGTPSILSITELQLLIDSVYANYQVTDNPEITLEANPDDLITQRIKELKTTQINRLSIGIQSFFDAYLKAMNRAHSAREAKVCLEEATKYFDNITIDLIYGFPDMTTDRWKENLHTAINFGVNHISSYALTVEPKTALADFIRKRKYPPVSEELAEAHFNILMEETAKAGFIHYEISNFGKPGYFSKHNTSYWLGKRYLGIGPSAHSYNGTQRSWNIANNVNYIRSISESKLPQEIENLTQKDRFNEYVMTGLRTMWGISLNTIASEFGEDYKHALLRDAQKFLDQQLIVIAIPPLLEKQSVNTSNNDVVLKTTQKGKFLCDGIASALFKVD